MQPPMLNKLRLFDMHITANNLISLGDGREQEKIYDIILKDLGGDTSFDHI